MREINEFLLQAALVKAMEISENAYNPYSKFSVGSAVITENNEIFSGCNIENASYGLTICAERNAIFQAVSKKNLKIIAVVIYTPTDKPTAPCGSCRQVINEFSDSETRVFSFCKSLNDSLEMTIEELLPDAFGPRNLK